MRMKFAATFLAGALSGALVAGALASAPDPVRCFEDEVIVWTGEAHTLCVPLDNLAP